MVTLVSVQAAPRMTMNKRTKKTKNIKISIETSKWREKFMEVLTRSLTPTKDVFYRKHRGEFRLATRIVICDSRFKADDLNDDVAHKIDCIALHLAYINKCLDLQIPSGAQAKF